MLKVHGTPTVASAPRTAERRATDTLRGVMVTHFCEDGYIYGVGGGPHYVKQRHSSAPRAAAPDVSTSSISTSLRPATSALPSAGTRNPPWIVPPVPDLPSPTEWP